MDTADITASVGCVDNNNTNNQSPISRDRSGFKVSIDALTDDQLRDKLRKHIVVKIDVIRDKLQYVSLKYDIVKNLFNGYSLVILIVSALITLSDAMKLLITKYITDNAITDLDPELIDFLLNILSLVMGTYMTIVASIIRFRNYREKMEKLREMQDKFIHVRAQYNREIAILNLNKNEQKSLLEEVQDKLTEYDQVVNEVNIISEITNEEMIQFSKKISTFKIDLNKIKVNEANRLHDLHRNQSVVNDNRDGDADRD